MIVNIKQVKPPSPQSSGKWGSIIDNNGMKIMVPIDMLGAFQAGTTVEVPTKEQTWFRGTPDEAIMQVATGGPEGPTRPVQGQGGQTGYQRPAGNQAPYRSNTGFQPRVVEGGRGKDQWTPEQTRWNFIMGIAGRAMGSGKFTASEIRVLTQEAAAAYDAISKPPRVTDTYAEPPLGLEQGDPGPELQ